MGILDEAIKEHLELKRQHGAGESELKKLEDEAFGAAERPGDESSEAASEAPTAFMTQPDLPEEAGTQDEGSAARRRPDPQIADLQEPPEPAESASHSTEERQAIAEQPTEMYDVEEELQESEAAEVEVTDAREEPEARDEADDLDDDFWDEKRLSDELDQALEAPAEPAAEVEPAAEDQPEVDVEPEPDVKPEPVAEEPDEDVLEETPDFLEETPEDDQLWFEQKPPKDFDFDD